MPVSIKRLAQNAAADRTITREEAQAIAQKATADGKITSYEKSQIRRALNTYKDLFTADAKAQLEPLLAKTPAPVPGGAINLDPTPSQRPVYLAADGSFTVNVNGAPGTTPAQKGDALYRAGELIDNARENLFASMPKELREKAFAQLATTLSTTPPAGFDERQALQARASSGTVLLHLLEASPEPDLKATMLKAYETAVRAEPNQRLKESFIFHLSNSPAAQTGEAKGVADKLMTQLAPLKPPYEKWFANGNDTVKMDWQIGSDFIDGFKRMLTNKGWKDDGNGVFTKTFNQPGVGETKFELRTSGGFGTDLLGKMNDPSVNIIGYDGHSNWGKNQVSSIKRAPDLADGGDGKLFLSNLCVGKSQIDAMKEKYPNLQYTTTYGSSAVDTDIDALAKFISQRAGWDTITPYLDRVDGHYDRNNFVTPISTLTREKVLDRDNDGQADYLDKHFNVSTFDVPADTRREFRPVTQDRPADVLDGTKVLISAQVLNTVSEFNGVLRDVNEHSKVVANGWFEPKNGEADVVKFEKVKGADGQPEYRMQVNAKYSHMSEEAMRATCVYELNRFLQSSGEQRLDPVDRKIMAVIGFAQSLDIDDSWRDDEVFNNFLERYNLPQIPRREIQTLLDAEHHDYAGSQAMVDTIKSKLPPDVLAQLKKPEVGEPVRYI